MKALKKYYHRLKKWLSEKSGNSSFAASDLHRSIYTLPIYAWWRIHESSDLELLMKIPGTPPDIAILNEAWQHIYNEYIDKFGFAESYLTLLSKKAYIAQLQCEMVETGDRAINMAIEVAKKELKQYAEKTTGKTDFFNNKAVIETHIGFRIDPMVVTVAEFYSYISVVKERTKNGNQR